MRKIYFAGSIRGGRDDRQLYKEIIELLRSFGEVLTEHIGDEHLSSSGEKSMTDQEIFDRDMDWLISADVIVAEVTTPSLGVGFEIASAISLKKKVLSLFRPSEGKQLSAMIARCREFEVINYQSISEVQNSFVCYFK